MSTTLFTVIFAAKRETKGAMLYEELGINGDAINDYRKSMIGALYVRKSAFAGKPPERIAVTVSHTIPTV